MTDTSCWNTGKYPSPIHHTLHWTVQLDLLLLQTPNQSTRLVLISIHSKQTQLIIHIHSQFCCSYTPFLTSFPKIQLLTENMSINLIPAISTNTSPHSTKTQLQPPLLANVTICQMDFTFRTFTGFCIDKKAKRNRSMILLSLHMHTKNKYHSIIFLLCSCCRY